MCKSQLSTWDILLQVTRALCSLMFCLRDFRTESQCLWRKLDTPKNVCGSLKGESPPLCFSFLSFLFFLFLFDFFRDRVSLYSPGCPGDQAGFELRNPPASASQSAGITGVRHHRLAPLCFSETGSLAGLELT